MRLRRRAALCGLFALAVLPAGAEAAGPPEATVDANGNALTGGLSFSPADVTINVGEDVEWTNTDFFAPHTATAEDGAFNLSGDYPPVIGALLKPFIGPLLGPGFGPGDTRSLEFSAPGTYKYFCEVHPVPMRGTVTVVGPPGAGAQPPGQLSAQGVQQKSKKKKKKKRKRKKRG